MTLQEFLIALNKVKDNFRWSLLKGEIIGAMDGHLFDPVTAVHYISVNKTRFCPLWKSRRIAKGLGLTEEIRCGIIRAACGVTLTREDRVLRKELLECLKLNMNSSNSPT